MRAPNYPAPLRPTAIGWLTLGLLLTSTAETSANEADGVAGLVLEPVMGGFSTAVDITQAGDDRLFVSEQGGRILIYDGSPAVAVFLDLSGLMGTGFEGGLKSLAFHPDYATNGFFFVHYSDVLGDSVIARYEVSAGDPNLAEPGSGVILLSVDQTTDLHRGGQLQFGPDGFLYVGLGDGGPQTDTECHAQRPDTLQGKLLRLDVDQNVSMPPFYGIPPDNPFGGAGEPAAEVWALGLRQPWRFSFDRGTGDLYIGDVGQNTREEVDRQLAGSPGGANYGWRIMEGTTCHDPDPIDPDCPVTTPPCDDASFTAPIFDYPLADGNCSVTGGYVYRGQQLSALVSRYLHGDWCSGRIWAAENNSGVWSREELPVNLPGIITFGEDRFGNIYLSDGASLLRLDDPSTVFLDGFESGDVSAWSSASRLP